MSNDCPVVIDTRVTTISPVSDLQRNSPQSCLDPMVATVSQRIQECTSYLSLYNYLNGLNDLIDQYAAVLKMTKYLCV